MKKAMQILLNHTVIDFLLIQVYLIQIYNLTRFLHNLHYKTLSCRVVYLEDMKIYSITDQINILPSNFDRFYLLRLLFFYVL